jgi:hypothetical protein
VNRASWFSTGGSRFLLKILKSSDPDLLKNMVFENVTLSISDIINSVDPEVLRKHIPLLLFQTGYLTFAPTVYEEQENYNLVFPNYHVKRSLSILIGQAIFKGIDEHEIPLVIYKLRDRDYKAYFDFIFLQFAELPFKLTAKDERPHEPVYHSRFSLINRVLAYSTRGITVEDFKVQATGNPYL